MMFQHTAARRRLAGTSGRPYCSLPVSTHSRPKAAGTEQGKRQYADDVSTHSRPKAAGHNQKKIRRIAMVSTHSRPKAAGAFLKSYKHLCYVSTHSRPKAAGHPPLPRWAAVKTFQHTAARRRLDRQAHGAGAVDRFNTQPPEGGWDGFTLVLMLWLAFQHTAARRRLARRQTRCDAGLRFNTQPPEGGWFAASTVCVL